MPPEHDPLTEREITVLRLLAQSVCVKQVTHRMHFNPLTIHFHLANILVRGGGS